MKLTKLIDHLGTRYSSRSGGVPIDGKHDCHATAQIMLDRYFAELNDAFKRRRNPDAAFPFSAVLAAAAEDFPSSRAILEADPRTQAAIVRCAVAWAYPPQRNLDDLATYFVVQRGGSLILALLGRKLDYQPDDIDWILAHIAACELSWHQIEFAAVGIQALLRSIHRAPAGQSLSPDARTSLEAIRTAIKREHFNSHGRKALELIGEMLGDDAAALFDDRDDWGRFALEALDQAPDSERNGWQALLKHSTKVTGTTPSQRWTARTRKLVAALGEDIARRNTIDWLALLDRPTRGVTYSNDGGYIQTPSAMVAARNSDALKGLIWASLTVADDTVTRALGDAALQCYRKIPDFGSRSTKAGNACVNALAELATPGAIVQLLRLLQRVKLRSVRNHIDAALCQVADARGMSREDIEDLATPTFNLVDGVAHIEIGLYRAEIDAGTGRDVTLRWIKPDGRAQKSVPAEVSRDYPADLKAVKGTVKELKTALQQQPWRIEASYLRDRSWGYPAWRERYIDHPLVSLTARRLIWSFSQGDREAAGAWLDGQLVGADDVPLDWLGNDATVRLWHPIQSGVNEVLAWREWLERHSVTQPFKQAHREIYVLTDAERQTETYSNRFAAHILRQHQFNALARERGWRYDLQGGWDSHNVPSLALPGGLQAEFWVEAVDGDESALSHSYIYLFVSTDQVCFTRPGQAGQIPLEEISPLVFTEVMRDVDLFVGAAGIGADPNWLDGGPGRMVGYQTYWWEVSFGDLSAAAGTRRDILARLLPRMAKLDGRWELDERFLKIRGDLRGYKIHLGSGNILMEPNDQYLCIVPGRGAGAGPAGNLYLPFEGDQALSVILSKALMLAADTAISDPTITRQIVPA